MSETKLCSGCKIVRSVDSFYNYKRSPDGRYRYCRACTKVMNHNYYVAAKSRRPKQSTLKQCKTCHESKPLTDFYKGRGKDGRDYVCKRCKNDARLKLYYARKANE